MAACRFVKTAIHKDKPLQTEEAIRTTREDLYTIENALKFVNDLVRSRTVVQIKRIIASVTTWPPLCSSKTHFLCFCAPFLLCSVAKYARYAPVSALLTS